MTEGVMFFGIGFLVATLLGLLIVRVSIIAPYAFAVPTNSTPTFASLSNSLQSRSVSGANCSARSR
jgi:hypothetical protein